jgi:cysteine desulfurase/selenocysteine lyase
MTVPAVFDVTKIREQFPVLQRELHGASQLIYLDSAATSQKPRRVLERMDEYYRNHNANIHRGIHQLAEEATAAYEGARGNIAAFIGCQRPEELIFTRNTTESINLVAHSWGRSHLSSGDVVLLTEMEHHSNIVPWQMLAQDMGLNLAFVSVTADGRLDLEDYERKLELGPKLVGFTHVSNVLGTINPVGQLTQLAHQAGAIVLVDGAQGAPHVRVDVSSMGVDFYAFSAHKMCGPTGIGALYGRRDLLESMPPFLGGGDMIRRVRLTEFRPNALPHKFEAGTPPIAEAIGFGAAVEFLAEIGMVGVEAHEHHMIEHAMERFAEIPGVAVLGPPAEYRSGVTAFTMQGLHPHDIAQILDREGIAVRAGHHCAMPLHEKYDIPASTRASFYLYNTRDEIDRLVEGLYKVKEIFS